MRLASCGARPQSFDPKKGDDLTRASHFQISVHERARSQSGMEPFYEVGEEGALGRPRGFDALRSSLAPPPPFPVHLALQTLCTRRRDAAGPPRWQMSRMSRAGR